MSGWIRWEKDIETDPRFRRLVRAMRDKCHARVTLVRDDSVTDDVSASALSTLAAGCLLRFWSYADTHIRADDQLDIGPADIDDLVGIAGFAAAMPEDWLVIINDGLVELPGYQSHNGLAAKKRALDNKRQDNKRSRSRHADVTLVSRNSVTEKRLDQTRPDQTKTNKEEGRANAPPFDPGGIQGLDPEAWRIWIEHRKAIKKPIRPHALQLAAEQLAALGGVQLVEVRRAVAGGWQGLHPETSNGARAPTVRLKTPDEIEAEERARAVS